MEKFVKLLNEYLEKDYQERQNFIPIILSALDNLHSKEVDDSFKDGIKENLEYQMKNNILSSEEIGKHLLQLSMLKFQ